MRRLQWLAARRPGQTRPAVVMAVLGLVMTACSSVPAVTPGIASRPVAPAAAPAPEARQGDVLASLPLAFEPVGGEGFVSRGPGFSVALGPADTRVAVDGGSFRLRPSGPAANPATRLVGRDPLPGTVTRLQGDDAARWSAGLPTYGTVVAGQVWAGVDMVWHGDQRRLEHDMVVGPGVDPSVVALDVDGAHDLTIDGAGDLVIDLGGATSQMARPVLYQDVGGGRRMVAGSFLLLGPSRIGFQVGAYDAGQPLVIDPTLVTSTYLGGSGADNGYGITQDKEGNTYVVGATESNDFPTAAPLQAKLALASAAGGPNSDVFVAKINPSGTGTVWSTYLGGGGRDTGYGVAVGPDGAVYVAGVTESVDFPRVKAAQDRYGGGASDGFVAKIAANGTALEWSTFLGGSQTDRVRGLAVDPSGSAYVTGSTSSVDFPSISAQQGGPYRPDDVDAFVAKLPATGSALVYATRLGGSNDDHGLAIAVDSQGSAFVTGDTLSPGFPTVRPFQSGSGGSAGGVAGSFPDAFVAKYNPTGSSLVYSTFLGGSDFDQGTAIAIDGSGAAYVTGNTNSPNFPTAGPLQARKDGDTDAFVAKLDPPGSALVYATYYGGSGADGGNAIAVDPAGVVVVAGTTGSPNLPMTRPVQPTKAGGSDAFVLRLNAAGNAPLFATFLGGRDEDQAMGVALDAQGMVHVLGLTSSGDFPTAKPLPGARVGAAGDAFLSGVSLADATVPVAVPAAQSSSSSHDRRLRALGILTLLLLALALAQTAYLRRRDRAARGARPVPAAAGRSRPGATAGLKVLPGDQGPSGPTSGDQGPSGPTSGDQGPSGPTSGDPDVTVVTGAPPSKGAAGTAVGAGMATSEGPAKPGSSARSRTATRSGSSKPGRAPKSRGGVKGGAPRSSPVAPPVLVPGSRKAPGTTPADDPRPGQTGGDEPPVAAPAEPAVPSPVPEPAIALLLEEDMWRPDPSPPKATPFAWELLTDDRSGETKAVPMDDQATQVTPAASFTFGQPVAPSDEPASPATVPPLPGEELSFWDLFPEDLPPVRPGGPTPDVALADRLPDNAPAAPPDFDPFTGSGPAVALRIDDDIFADTGARPEDASRPPGATELPPPPSAAERVMAELLNGPAPAARRPPSDLAWEPEDGGRDLFVSDLLADTPSPSGGRRRRTAPGTDVDEDEAGGEDLESAEDSAGRSPEEQARIAAERARRRRSRRGGRRSRPGGGDGPG